MRIPPPNIPNAALRIAGELAVRVMLRQFGPRVEIRDLPAYNRALLFAHVLDPIGAGARELPLTEKPPRISDLTRSVQAGERPMVRIHPPDTARKR